MNDSTEDTIRQMSDRELLVELLKRFNDYTQRFDVHTQKLNEYPHRNNAKLEAIRRGVIDDGIALDRLEAQFFNLRADVKELAEEVRRSRKVSA